MSKFMFNCVRWIRTLRYMKKIWQDGGITQVSMSQIAYGEILRGKSVLITGGSSGIGLAIARKCLSEGAEVVITGRNSDKLNSVSEELASVSLHTIQWDVSDMSLVRQKLEECRHLLGGKVDILVNNAGVLLSTAFFSVTEDAWDRTYAVNSKGLFFVTQGLSKWWIDNKQSGKIINVSSTGGFLGAPYPYRMTKWDIVGLTTGLGKTLSPYGIIVNGIAPGRTATEMIGRGIENIYDNQQPVGRLGLPEEIAELALFLMSDAANYIVGQTIICDGGYTLKI